ncbi:MULTISPECIES: toxin-antitoxin system YwqK family antitoxin [Providencia]|uniref:MORN repeat variant n=1 Tax=Providencia rettgeri TaxID=587 RepID=A0A427HML1_PRORE|nr:MULTISPECIES: hypothetical protein [Providencia]ELR5072649.1 hypothetical protein [Providencia stuartii]ELR5069804.1 hypothetical protein [Providencia rettgeri]ELR5216195.1 hypothetical protein [Providencia rettgeri]ELR5221137.1 hypothetical protein [Providencia rettgeri]MBV2191291.1 hypothetical protein [Providencia rettgeri]
MFKLKPIKSIALLSLVLFVSGCQLGSLTNSNSNSDSKFGELSELKKIEFPTIEAPKGLSEGAFETEFDNGQPKFKTWVSKGCFDKYIKTYYENGKPESQIQLKNCNVNGTIRNYHESGRIDTEFTALQGKLSGPFKIYHDTPSNKPNITGTFKNGDLVGTVTEFDENGTVISKAVIRDGEIIVLQ